MASVKPSLRIVKSIPFKGGTRLYSNRYFFSGGVPADDAHWHTLMDAVTTAEKATLSSAHTIVQAFGYLAGSDVAVSNKVYSLAGTCAGAAGSTGAPGEVAALVRWSTAARSTKNHLIYLFSYVYRPNVHSGTDMDSLDANMKTALGT